MMPMVFCASLPPCPRLYAAEETSCSRRNHLSTRRGVWRKQIHETLSMISEPSAMPSIGETMMNDAVLMMPGASSGAVPAAASAAPIMPPMSACEELDGMP